MTPEDGRLGLLAASAIVGGGAIGFAAVQAAQAPGGILGTEGGVERAPLGVTGTLALGAAAYLIWDAYGDAAKKLGFGWQPLVIGTAVIAAGSALVQARR